MIVEPEALVKTPRQCWFDLLEGESGTISSKILTVVVGSIMPSNPAAAGALKLMKS